MITQTSPRSSGGELIAIAQKECKISFNLENDDGCEQKDVTIPTPDTAWKSERDGKVLNDKKVFCVELCQAGGDWEVPVMYFRCQEKKSARDIFVLIPTKAQGNKYLVTEKGKTSTPNNNDFKGDIDFDYKELWKSVEIMLKQRMDDKKKDKISRIAGKICNEEYSIN